MHTSIERRGVSGLCSIANLTIAALAIAALTACGRHGGGAEEQRIREPAVARPSASTPAKPRLAEDRHVQLKLGQQLYLPVYSSVYGVDEKVALDLTVTVSIRNTATTAIVVDQVDYFGGEGAIVERVLKEPLTLGPLQAQEYVIRRRDVRGGTGASFLVSWHSVDPATQPVVQAVNSFMGGNQSFAFVTSSTVLRETWAGDADAQPATSNRQPH